MPQLFLTSSVHAVAHHIGAQLDLSSKNSLVFIDTPAETEEGDKQWLADDRQALVDAGFLVRDYTITGKVKEQLQSDLAKFDYIYVSGGDTKYMLKESHKSGFFELIKDLVLNQGKTYIGTSAGSIIAGEKCPDYLLSYEDSVGMQHQTGFGFINVTIAPHWGSPHFKELYLGGRLEIAYRDTHSPLLLLTDTQYVHVLDGQMNVVQV
jgi:peptidase E